MYSRQITALNKGFPYLENSVTPYCFWVRNRKKEILLLVIVRGQVQTSNVFQRGTFAKITALYSIHNAGFMPFLTHIHNFARFLKLSNFRN